MKKNKILPELVMFRLIQAILLVGIFKDAYNHEFMAAAFHTLLFWGCDWACQVARRYHSYKKKRS